MRIDIDQELEQVVLRHDTKDVALRGAALAVGGVAVPLWVQATVPALIVPALLLTIATAFWAVTAMSAVLILDDLGVTASAARRGRGRIAWGDVAALELARFRIAVRTTAGARVEGPPADAALLERLLEAAWTLGILPAHIDRRTGGG